MLLEPQLQAIELDVANLQFDHSQFKQKAWPSELLMRFLRNGDVELCLTMERQAHGLDASGELGAAVPADYVRLEPVKLLASNAVAVDPRDGFPRYRLRSETMTVGQQTIAGSAYNTLTQELEQFATSQDWRQFLRDLPGTYMLQPRYFGVMCAREDVNIFELLLAYAQQADAPPSVFAVQP